MTSDECIANALQNGLQEKLDQLEFRRLELLQDSRKSVLNLLAITFLTVVVVWIFGECLITCLFVAALFLILGFNFIQSNKNRLIGQFKQETIPILLESSLPGFKYTNDSYVSESDFNSSRLFSQPDRYGGKDHFEGLYGKTSLHFSLVQAEERHETTTTEEDSNGNTTTRTEEYWVTIFQGLFFVADFNKHFSGFTTVKSGRAGILSGLSSKLVKLEDPRFSQHFTVYSTDQVEVRYLLTPKMIERLIELQNRLGHVDISFENSWINIAAGNFPYNAFEPNINEPLNNVDHIKRTLDWIFHVVGIVEELDLNTRIWSKT